MRIALDHNPHLKPVVHEEIRNFREPVTVLPDYEQRKQVIWREGISSIDIFRTNGIEPLLRYLAHTRDGGITAPLGSSPMSTGASHPPALVVFGAHQRRPGGGATPMAAALELFPDH